MKNLNFSTRFLLVARRTAALTLASVACAAHAISFTAIEAAFSASGRAATQVLRLENTTAQAAAVEVSVKTRKIKRNGEDVLRDSDDQFSIFAAQVVLKPGPVQTIRPGRHRQSISKHHFLITNIH